MSRLVFTIIETLRSRCGHVTANDKPRLAICGSTLLACLYSFTFILAEKLYLKITFRRKNSIADKQKSSKRSVFSQMWDYDVIGCKKNPWGKSPTSRAWSSRTNVNLKLQTCKVLVTWPLDVRGLRELPILRSLKVDIPSDSKQHLNKENDQLHCKGYYWGREETC